MIERPGKIVAIGLNYHDHARESGMEPPKVPLVFAKFPSAVINHEEQIVIPRKLTERVDWEVELAVVIGERASHVSQDEAFMWADIELHALIARAAANAVLSRLLESIAGMGLASRRRTGRLAAVRKQSAQDHREIAAAIAAHDADAAYAAMLRHLENVEQAVTG